MEPRPFEKCIDLRWGWNPGPLEWGLFIKMATGCESQRWGTLADPQPGRGHGDEWIDCVGSLSASPRPVDDCLLLPKSVPVIPHYGHQMRSIFLWETWLEKQAETTKGYLSSELAAWHVAIDHRSSISIVGSGHRSCTCTVNPNNFFLLLCRPFYISRVSLYHFFSCIVALHKH